MRYISKVVVSTCEKHAPVEILSDDVAAHVIEFPGSENVIHQYRINCPLDNAIIVKNCEPRVHDLLHSVGVVIKKIEMPEPEADRDLPPVDENDLARLLTDLDNC